LIGKSILDDFQIKILPSYIENPIQIDIENGDFFEYQGDSATYFLEIKAIYELKAIVKSKKKYTTDRASCISKYDIAVAWGELNRPEIDKHIKYTQSGRWYFYTYDKSISVSSEYISRHSANVHIIPADDEIEKILKGVKENDFIEIHGYLVYVKGENFTWNSSLKRDDTGDGACEILYAEKIIIHE
jgi:hypothetical protein